MSRLPNFNYKSPYFYMVTLKRRREKLDFSSLSPEGLVKSPLTKSLERTILDFHKTWYCVEPIHYFIVMPDHIHLILKLLNIANCLSLPKLVRQLIKALERAYSQCCNTPIQAVFEQEWHDWIVKKEGQLKAFQRYIRENPRRAWLRLQNRPYFTQLQPIQLSGREWQAYGNVSLLEYPVIEAFQCSRRWEENGTDWKQAMMRASRIGPGGVGIGTFLSPCEKACGNAIYQAGGSFIVLSPEGFSPRWHPTRAKEQLCADGRMLFLSLYPPSSQKLDNATLYTRCHEMGDLVVNTLR
ncbi:MAG: hypothetical protein IJJ26_09340 [Victivallales bacterium]|nr:hypothetical protein [Victivallales bacterium]